MPYRRRGTRRMSRAFQLRPIQSYKHVIDFSLLLDTQTGTNVRNTMAIVRAFQTLDRSSTADEIQECKIPWIYYDLTYSNGDTSGAADTFDMYLMKRPNLTPSTVPTPGATGTDEDKPRIFKEWKAILPINDRIIKDVGVVRVPRTLQKMKLFDDISFVIRHTCATFNMQAKFIFKEIA